MTTLTTNKTQYIIYLREEKNKIKSYLKVIHNINCNEFVTILLCYKIPHKSVYTKDIELIKVKGKLRNYNTNISC